MPLLAAVAALALATACADQMAPAVPVLTVGTVTASSIQIRWTAVGDDGARDTATSQELRSLSGAACPITQANFATGAMASGLGAPQAPGASESATVSGLAGDTSYCFMLRVMDEAGNASFSAAVSASTTDVVGPAQAVLSAGTVGGTSVTVSWTAVGDNGTSGTASAQELRYASGSGCPLTSTSFAQATLVSGAPAPAAAGTSQSATVSGLLSQTTYCFALGVRDEAGNSSLSPSLDVTTLDVVPPAAAALSAGATTGSSVALSWTAVGDDGTSGTATGYELRYRAGASCPIDATNFSTSTQVAGLPAPLGAGTAESFTVSSLTSDTAYCFMLRVSDEAGNSSLSNALAASTPDVTPPAAAGLSAGAITASSVALGWTAVGDDGTSGRATGYELRYRAGASCPIDAANFSTSTQVAGLPAPLSAGTAESFTVSSLTSDTAYCFMLRVSDEAGNSSLSNALAASTPDITPPAAAALSATVTDTAFNLSWTAVGDDGNTGTAASQELRYLGGTACPIDASNFATGTVVSGLGAPAAAGTAEAFTAGGLQRQTRYCFALRVSDEAGNASVSNSFEAVTPDTTPPNPVFVSTGIITSLSVEVQFASVGDDGATGTAASYDLRYLSGAACPVTDTNFDGATPFATPAPQPPGSTESVVVTGLSPGTGYCFAVRVSDDVPNVSPLSNSASATTFDDTTPPGPVADLAAAQQGSGALRLTWTAVADDGTNAATGPAASYDLRYLSGAACPIGSGNFAGATVVPGMPAPAAPGVAEAVTVSGLAAETSYCFLLRVTDPAGNSSFSGAASGTTVDDAAPAAVADLLASGPDAHGAIQLTWTASGDNGSAGTAASYDLRYQAGDCATFDFATATAVTGLPSPQPSGTAESFGVTLSPTGRYCFALRVSDEIPNTSTDSNLAGATPDPSAQMAQIRTEIHAAPGSPVALSAGVRGAIVTYVKAAAGGAPVGSADGPGFFVQNGDTGPALFLAVDPAVVLPGVAPGDVVDLSITQAAWLGCSAPPCTADNSLYAITQVTATPTASGVTLPLAQDLTAVTVPVPIGAGPWDLEHERVTVTGGTVGALSPGGTGFRKAQLTTPANTSPDFQLRVPETMIAGSGLIAGCRATVSGTPMWRTDASAQVAAWLPAELTLANCPAIAFSSSAPADGSRNVAVDTTYALAFNQPLTPATVTFQAANGPCVAGDTLQLSADPGFVNCVGIAVVASGQNDVYTITPAAPLASSSRYRARLRNPAGSPNGNVVSATTPVLTPNGLVTAGTPACTPRAVVISQIYGGGGNFGSLYRNDFIELHNRSSAPVDLTGWSVQYTSAAGTGTWQVTNLSGTIAAGGYYLVQEAQGTGGTLPLPTPDAIGIILMSATNGKVALVSTTTALTGGCPTGPTIVDLVGFGATASCFQGAPTGTLSNPVSAAREELACSDTGSNNADFALLTLTASTPPRNTASPANTCSCP